MQLKRFAKPIILILSIIIIFTVKKGLISALVPFIIALFIYFLLKPLCIALEELNVKRSLSSLFSILILLLFLTAFIFLLIPPILDGFKRLFEALPSLIDNFSGIMNGLITQIQCLGFSEDLTSQLLKQFDNMQNSIIGFLNLRSSAIPTTLFSTITVITNFFIGLIITFYLLNDRNKILNLFLSNIPIAWHKRTRTIIKDIGFALSSYIRGELLVIFIIAFLQSIGLFFIGIPEYLSLGLIGGVFNIIPYFGPVMGAIPAVLVALSQSNTKTVLVILLYVSVQQLDGTIISPKVMEKKLHLHPLVTIFAVLLGGNLMGILGMLLAVPTAAVFIAICKNIKSILKS